VTSVKKMSWKVRSFLMKIVVNKTFLPPKQKHFRSDELSAQISFSFKERE